ncbi:hypothetical protein GCM10022422_17440 [Flavobacterium ginsengisoli]|uniref:Uncharacterized protein n=1 Tax=Flavobacterium ginsengisoli TaxID=871694 RepID=A0ABP7FDQ3_9FLAO|nr:hypothetical protein [Flavobacterium ginsengisoli]
MSTNYNRIKVADLETNQPDKILKTNENGELEFSDISEKESDPVSATTAGIVNNTALQELGGADKTINGIRIGMGGGNLTQNTALGRNTLLYNTTGEYNTGLARNTLVFNTTGSYNTGVGSGALNVNTTGQRNTAIGSRALSRNTTGSFNTVLGEGAGTLQTTANNNILFGFQAGRAITTGSNNLLIENTINDGVTTGNKNIILNPLSTGVTGIHAGNNNTLIGGLISLTDLSDHIIIATGTGAMGFISDNTGLTRVPRQTNALIAGDTTGKAIITKEYLATSLPSLTTTNVAPSSATATGVKGDIRIDNDYVYICVNTNTWKRSALTTW